MATQTEEPLPWEIEGPSQAGKIIMQVQQEQKLDRLKADQRAKDTNDLMMKTWTAMTAMATAAGVTEKMVSLEWWEEDGQCNLFAHIALEKGVSPEAVPDEIMKLIKGTCWAEALLDDLRINDYANKPFLPCGGKLLTAEQNSRWR